MIETAPVPWRLFRDCPGGLIWARPAVPNGVTYRSYWYHDTSRGKAATFHRGHFYQDQTERRRTSSSINPEDTNCHWVGRAYISDGDSWKAKSQL